MVLRASEKAPPKEACSSEQNLAEDGYPVVLTRTTRASGSQGLHMTEVQSSCGLFAERVQIHGYEVVVRREDHVIAVGT